MSTKKLLVSYDELKPNAGNGDFLAVLFEGITPIFYGLKSHCVFTTGRMVFLGKEVSVKDIFARLVDSGRNIDEVDGTIEVLTAYLQQIEQFKIGNVITVASKSEHPGFELIKVSEMPKAEAKSLP